MQTQKIGQGIGTALAGHPVQRKGWIQSNWHLVAKEIPGLTGKILVRVNADGSVWPWGPTDDDLFATDYVRLDGGDLVEAEEGTFCAVLPAVEEGKTIGYGNIVVELDDFALGLCLRVGNCLVVILPDGEERLFRPQIHDLTRTGWFVIPG